MNFYKRFMSDYAKKTARLTLAQHGAYTLLLDEVYSTESPLPADVSELFRICRAMTKDEQSAVRVVADLYFPVGDSGLRHNPRASIELNLASPSLEAARLNGTKGGRPRKEPIEFENNNPVGFQDETNSDIPGLTPHSLEEYQGAKAPSSGSEIPDCPHEDLIDLFAQCLPAMAQPRKSLWRAGKNAPALRSRWRWVLTEKYESGKRAGQRMALSKDDGVAWFTRFFEYVAKSDFLTGKNGKFTCDLGWLVNQSNFEKVLSGKYENKTDAS